MSNARIELDMPEAEYHSRPEVSKHDLDLIAKAPLLYRYRKDNPEEPDDEMNFGSLFHLAALQPDLLDSIVAFLPKDAPNRVSDRNRNAAKPSQSTLDAIKWWDDWSAANTGKKIVTHEQYERIKGMRDSLYTNPSTRRLLEVAGPREASIFWNMEGVDCRARLDILGDGIIIDPKTCGDASRRGFERDMGKFGYHRQSSQYSEAAKAIGRPAKNFVFVVVETKAPYLSTFYKCSETAKDIGRIENLRLLHEYRICKARNEWPNMADPDQDIEVPSWCL